MLTEIVT